MLRVQAHLLAVVLADVRVVPVDAGIGAGDAVGERAADRDRRLGLVRAVVGVLEPQPVPVHRRLEVRLVADVDDHLGALAHLQRRAGDRPVVGEHAHRGVAEALRHGRDPQVELVPVREFDDLRGDRLREAGNVAREVLGGLGGDVVSVVLHGSDPFCCGSCARRALGGVGRWTGSELTDDELGVLSDPADERRAARVLPGEADEVEPGNVGHAAAVADAVPPRRRREA